MLLTAVPVGIERVTQAVTDQIEREDQRED
jgi:hypothetical protein